MVLRSIALLDNRHRQQGNRTKDGDDRSGNTGRGLLTVFRVWYQ